MDKKAPFQRKSSDLRKSLVLRRARQLGKTYILNEFAKWECEDHVYINFDETPHFASFFRFRLAWDND